jgi:polynucleotide 5'-triphosphatase
VTRNEKTGDVLATVKKVRLGNLDVYSPKRAADWRISVNVEVPGAYPRSRDARETRFLAFLSVQHPLGSPTHQRRKDRISYSHEEFIVDLTQVASYGTQGAQVGCITLPKPISPQSCTARAPPRIGARIR